MRKTKYQKISKKEIKRWKKDKQKEWKENADFWIKIIQKNLDPYRLKITNKAILERVKKEKNLKILDAGCGEGYLSRMLAKSDHKVFGIDTCKKLIVAAKRKQVKETKYFVKDFRNTGFPSCFFDIIICHQTIIEIQNPERAFKEFSRILKKNGKLILLFSHPCFELNMSQIKKVPFPLIYFQKIKVKKDYYLVSGIKSPSCYFYLHLPLSKWSELLEKNGFVIKSIEEPHPPLNALKRNKMWQKKFKKPLFILIEAVKFFN